ncbi:MAG: RND transporter [Gammaproteobacteria bacterium]|nr:RND transporter [Gammaproteobacteria bacterium]
MKWIDKIPFLPLIIVAIVLAIAPYPAKPEPHLIEKLGMLTQGLLVSPVDIFDLFWHSFPVIFIIIKLFRLRSGTT